MTSPPRTLQAVPMFVFYSSMGTDLDKGDSRVYFLHLEALGQRGGKLKTGFAHFLETLKQVGGQGKGQRVWQGARSETKASDQQIKKTC